MADTGEEAPKTQRVVQPKSAEEVAKCLLEASSIEGCTVSVVGGDHSGYGRLGDIILEMRHHFNNVVVNTSASTVTVGAGATAAEIARAASEHGLAVSLGTAPTVGLGLVLQGGIGHLGRSLGLAVDAIVGAEIVTVDGTWMKLEKGSMDGNEEQLFWALCGCAPNFAVVLSVTLSAFPYRTCDHVRCVYKVPDDDKDAVIALKSYAERSVGLPRDCSCDCSLFFGPYEVAAQQDEGDSGGFHPLFFGVYDFDYSNCARPPLILPESARLISQATMQGLTPQQLFEHEAYLCELPSGQVQPGYLETRGFFVRAIFVGSDSRTGWQDVLIQSMKAAPNELCAVNIQHTGGAVSDRPSNSTAFSAREMEWSVVVTGCWHLADGPISNLQCSNAKCRSWVLETIQNLMPFACGTYPTDLGPEDEELARNAFGGNLQRLLELKSRWDPRNVLGCGFPLARIK